MSILENSKIPNFLVSIMMIVILLFFNSTVQAAVVGDYSYIVTDGKAQITKYTGTGRIIAIPSTIDGFPVTSIGGRAFDNCTRLTNITIPQSVTSMGEWAFAGCTGLTTINIPKGVTSIGENPFLGCAGLTGINVADDNSYFTSLDGALYNKDGNILLAYPEGLNSVSIPQRVTSIGDCAFWECTGLTSVTLPQGVISIGKLAFAGCTGLTNIGIPEGVTSIGDAAFGGCTGLTTISIPHTVSSIGDYPFSRCTGLTSINVDAGNLYYTSIDGILFNKTGTILIECPAGLTSISIPQGVSSIGNSAFFGCNGLTTISIPQGVTSIGEDAFYSCTRLTSINIPQGVTSIGDYAFVDCKCLLTISIPEGVTSIGGNAFVGCIALKGISIPQGVTSIGYSAFYGCKGLKSISIPQGVTSISDHAFEDCTSLTSITIPKSVTIIGLEAFYGCTGLTAINFYSTTTTIHDCETTIPAATKIIGYQPSTAKSYAIKHNRKFEVIDAVPDVNGTGAATLYNFSRISGKTRFDTAKAIAYKMAKSSIQDLIIVSGNEFPDALSVSVLAKKLNAPVLLVDCTVEGSSATFDYIKESLQPSTTIHIVGGSGVISSSFETKLNSLGFYNIDRISGYDRYKTCALIAHKLAVTKGTPVVVASGTSFPDALSISSIAAAKGYPILLTESNSLSQDIKEFITSDQPSKVYVVGGTAVISNAVLTDILSCLSSSESDTLTRIAGFDRFETNTKILSQFSMSPKTIYVASGLGFPDALAGSSLAASTSDPVLLIDPTADGLPESVRVYLKSLYTAGVYPDITAFGGEVVVPDYDLSSIRTILKGQDQ